MTKPTPDLRGALAAGDPDAVTTYQESGMRELSRIGRFDAVRLLLAAGADKALLEWTPLMEAVALGSLEDVAGLLAGGASLEETDWWSRTAWLIALLGGDLAKIELLAARGARTETRGRCGQPPLFFAIDGHHAEAVRWLLERGQDVDGTDEFGATALVHAVEADDLECVDVLLGAGADVGKAGNGTAIDHAISRPVAMRLLEAGADLAEISEEGGRRALLGLPPEPDAELLRASLEEFQLGWMPRFGNANPQRMQVRYWESMIRAGISGYEASVRFGVPRDGRGGPKWCAQRFGQSLTFLPDGRMVQIAGEHEDYSDPDFFIYNDVFVHGADRSIAIYGYPEAVFPPTDFHTATLLGEHIYVIGSVGYMGTRRFGTTPVYRLDIRTFAFEPVRAEGEAPGWIFRHRAKAISTREIRVWGGTIAVAGDVEKNLKKEKEEHVRNDGSFVLDVERRLWRRDAG